MTSREVKIIVLSTEDLDASIAFYTDTLGFPLRSASARRIAASTACRASSLR